MQNLPSKHDEKFHEMCLSKQFFNKLMKWWNHNIIQSFIKQKWRDEINHILFAEFIMVSKSLKFRRPSLSRSALVNISNRFSWEIESSNFSSTNFKSSIEIEPSPSYHTKAQIKKIVSSSLHIFTNLWKDEFDFFNFLTV